MKNALFSYIKNVSWLPQPNRVELYFTDKIPNIEQVAAVFIYAFDSTGNMLMVKKPKGSWDIPGGGREQEESIEQTAKREALEEGAAVIKNIEIIAYQKIILNCEKPGKYRRPYPEAYEVFVKAEVDELLEFKISDETIGREIMPESELILQEGIQFENRHVIYDKTIK